MCVCACEREGESKRETFRDRKKWRETDRGREQNNDKTIISWQIFLIFTISAWIQTPPGHRSHVYVVSEVQASSSIQRNIHKESVSLQATNTKDHTIRWSNKTNQAIEPKTLPLLVLTSVCRGSRLLIGHDHFSRGSSNPLHTLCGCSQGFSHINQSGLGGKVITYSVSTNTSAC